MARTKLKLHQAIGEYGYFPRGLVINGKIVVTVASNNITIALKTYSGNDPSVASPVIANIGGTIRKRTSALSVTIAAGANTFNSGSAELATQEVDYFAYLGYNTTDGMTIGVSTISDGFKYGDFSTTATDDYYCAISTITNASANDPYELIGRFAATLSAGAGYTWSVPTFTNRNLVQGRITETRNLSWAPQLRGTPSTSSLSSVVGSYKVKDGVLEFFVRASLTKAGSPSGTFGVSLPRKSIATSNTYYYIWGSLVANSAHPITAMRGIPYINPGTNGIDFESGAGATVVSWATVANGDFINMTGKIQIRANG